MTLCTQVKQAWRSTIELRPSNHIPIPATNWCNYPPALRRQLIQLLPRAAHLALAIPIIYQSLPHSSQRQSATCKSVFAMLTFAPPCPCRATTFRAFAVPVPSICRRSTLHIARRTRSQSTLLMVARPVWEVVQGCDVVLPAETGSGPPKALVHFIGGLGAGAAPKRLYAAFLERLAERGQVAVVATPVGTGFDHDILSRRAAELSSDVIRVLQNRWNTPWIPVVRYQ